MTHSEQARATADRLTGVSLADLRRQLAETQASLDAWLAAYEVAFDQEEEHAIEPMLTTAEVAAVLQVSKSTVYELTRTGQLRSLRLGDLVRVNRADLSRFMTKKVEESDNPYWQGEAARSSSWR